MNVYATLLHYAHHRDDASLERLVEAHVWQFNAASRWAMHFGLVTGCGLGIFVVPVLWRLGALGAAIALGWIALIALLRVVDQWRRRRATRRSLEQGSPAIHHKLRIGEPDGTMFQSYWTSGPHELELDHPLSLLDAVKQADEFWRWQMRVPWHDGRRVKWLDSNFEVGLVRRRADGTPELIAGGQVFYDWDPWTQRVKT